MKTTALNGNMVITDNGGMTIMERIKRYFAERSNNHRRLPYDERRELKRGIQNAGKIIYKSLYFRGRRQRMRFRIYGTASAVFFGNGLCYNHFTVKYRAE